MEALTAVSIAALTIYDMCKAVDKKMRIANIRLRFENQAITHAPVNRMPQLNAMQIHIGIITVSDRASQGHYEDLGGPALKQAVEGSGWK